jgi:hypothetical protein
MTADEAISRYKQATVRREFPGQFLGSTLDEIEDAAERGDAVARKALKLLLDHSFDK